MFLKTNVKKSLVSKSNWFSKNSINYKKHIYEDIFIRKYVSSFFYKWSKFSTYKIIGSIYLYRTYAKLCITVYFFCPFSMRSRSSQISKKSRSKFLVTFKKFEVKPISKCRKHLTILLFFYQLELILGVQVFFKFRNISNGLINGKIKVFNALVHKVYNYLLSQFLILKSHFSGEVYSLTIFFLVNLFKFRIPDSLLLANFIATIFLNVKKHSQYLLFVQRVVCFLKKLYSFQGVKIQISGKLDGFSRAQSKQIQVGRLSIHSFDAFYVKGYSQGFTNAGKIGIKVWIS